MYRNRYCYCERRLITQSSEIEGKGEDAKLILHVSEQGFTNLTRRSLIIAHALPKGANSLPVFIMSGKELIPILVKTGNFLRADQLKTRRRYPIIFGDDPIHFSLEIYVPRTCHSSTEEEMSVATEYYVDEQ